tara:strand:+ start:1082 stop:1213 length:132 start_codon:yes stop_codon:yes gene_type:complete
MSLREASINKTMILSHLVDQSESMPYRFENVNNGIDLKIVFTI